jgi:hypothetical protein
VDLANCGFGKGSHFSPSIAPRERSIEPSSIASPERPIDPSQQANIPPAASASREPSIEPSSIASPERPIDPSQQANIPPAASAPREPSIEPSSIASPERPVDPSQQANVPPAASYWPFVKKRMVRTAVGGLLTAVVVAVVWQTYRDNETRKLIKALGHSPVIWLSSPFVATERDSASAAHPGTKLSDQAAQTPTVMSLQADEVAELKQQLQTVVNDLAVIRRDVEQLSSKHEQMSRDIATVQANEQNVSEKISSLTQPAPAPARGQPRKNVPRLVRAETPRQPDAASVPSQTSPTGTASLTDQPPRPPLPVPTPTGTPSPFH